jgi:hypothetical protein
MAYDLNGTNQHLNASAPIDCQTKPFTLACWFNSDTITDNQYLVSIGSNNDAWAITAHGNIAGDPVLCIQTGVAGTSWAASTAGYSQSAWQHVCGVFTSTSSRTVYLNGGNNATNTVLESGRAAATRLDIGVTRFSNAFTQYTNGRIAEVGIWNTDLTAAEIASLAKGMTCDKVRPQSLVFYAPLVRDLVDVKGGLTITNNNTATVANHPRVYA